jgi:hypothetical protein
MILDGAVVLNYMRVSPTLLVCALEGDRTFSVRGTKEYVDDQESHFKEAFSTGKQMVRNTVSLPEIVLNLPNGDRVPLEAPAGEELLVPQHDFTPKDKRDSAPVVNATVDDEHLRLPVYDFSRMN